MDPHLQVPKRHPEGRLTGNVKGHLPARLRDDVDARLRGAFADPDPAGGLRKAKALAAELDKTHPDADGSLREGLEDMFTVRRLGIDGTLGGCPVRC